MPAPTAIELLAPEPPTYQLSRGITTIPDLWREWTVGLGGQLSVEALDER
jgi:Transcriptional activator of glycolytic enzymes